MQILYLHPLCSHASIHTHTLYAKLNYRFIFTIDDHKHQQVIMTVVQPTNTNIMLVQVYREELDKVCAADGQVIGDEHGILERWREYFAGLLQRDTQVTDDGVGDGAGELQEEDSISFEEVAKAIGKLKNRKAPGVCGINAEMLKGGGGIVVRWLRSVIQLMWKRGEVVEDWRRAIIVPLHKKGSKLACSNYIEGLAC